MAPQTVVFVPGSHHGGWSFEPVTGRLRAAGHRVFPLTLPGVAERHRGRVEGTNLDDHIADVTAVLEAEQLEHVVLCGHSYGGMVITGVADRVPARIGSLVYLDAFVPGDGDSVWAITSESERQRYLQGIGADGFTVPPMPFFDPRATGQPLATFLQAIRLTGAWTTVARRTYVRAAEWPDSPFVTTARQLSQDPRWTVHLLDGGHNLMRDVPDELTRIILDAARAPVRT